MRKILRVSKNECKGKKNIGKWLNNQDNGIARDFNSSNIVAIEEYEDCWHVVVDDEIIYF